MRLSYLIFIFFLIKLFCTVVFSAENLVETTEDCVATAKAYSQIFKDFPDGSRTHEESGSINPEYFQLNIWIDLLKRLPTLPQADIRKICTANARQAYNALRTVYSLLSPKYAVERMKNPDSVANDLKVQFEIITQLNDTDSKCISNYKKVKEIVKRLEVLLRPVCPHLLFIPANETQVEALINGHYKSSTTSLGISGTQYSRKASKDIEKIPFKDFVFRKILASAAQPDVKISEKFSKLERDYDQKLDEFRSTVGDEDRFRELLGAIKTATLSYYAERCDPLARYLLDTRAFNIQVMTALRAAKEAAISGLPIPTIPEELSHSTFRSIEDTLIKSLEIRLNSLKLHLRERIEVICLTASLQNKYDILKKEISEQMASIDTLKHQLEDASQSLLNFNHGEAHAPYYLLDTEFVTLEEFIL